MKNEKAQIKDQSSRRFVRIKADAGTIVQIELKQPDDLRTFTPNILALVHEESKKGFSIVGITHRLIKVGLKCRVKVGRLNPRLAEVRWRRDLDGDVMRVGFQYLD